MLIYDYCLCLILFLVFIYKFYFCSQELLAAVEKERLLRSRKVSSITSPTIYYTREDEDEDEDSDHVRVYFCFKNMFDAFLYMFAAG